MENKIKQKILVEGPDCSGKSTLVNLLKNSLRWDAKSLHHRDNVDQYERYVREYDFGDKIVFDRGHISEHVYSMLWKREEPFDIYRLSVLNRKCSDEMVVIFSCPESFDVLRERYSSRSYKQQIRLDELERSFSLFNDFFKNLPCLRYFSKDYDELNKLVLNVKAEVTRDESICYPYRD